MPPLPTTAQACSPGSAPRLQGLTRAQTGWAPRRASSWQQGAGSFLASGLCLLPASRPVLVLFTVTPSLDSCPDSNREAVFSGPLCPARFPPGPCVLHHTLAPSAHWTSTSSDTWWPWKPYGGWVWLSGLCLTLNLKGAFLLPYLPDSCQGHLGHPSRAKLEHSTDRGLSRTRPSSSVRTAVWVPGTGLNAGWV